MVGLANGRPSGVFGEPLVFIGESTAKPSKAGVEFETLKEVVFHWEDL
jgi:hypothetical protein